MKKSNIILLFLMALAWAGCHKDKEMNAKDPVVLNVEVSVSETQARFSWQVDFAGEFHTSVEVSQDENMSDLKRVEATKEGEKYVAVVDSLTAGTELYYRILVWNKFNNYEQEVKSFSTTPLIKITVTCVPEEGGTVTGEGSYITGDTCILKATANTGYIFLYWTENGQQISDEMEYSFTVTSDRHIVANFILIPTGAIKGLFTINENGDQVFFSQGNLQYHTEDSVWRFALHQYDTIGGSAWQSLFGWGTGNNPTLNSEYNDDYSTFVDWGVNAISNGGNQASFWRTLSSEEWEYLIYDRLDASTKFGIGNVDGVGGLIILPDKWTCPIGLAFNPGFSTSYNDWSHNTYTTSQWQQMENAGAVFLPRIWSWVYFPGMAGGGYVCLNSGYYWSVDWPSESATFLFFTGGNLIPQNYDYNEYLYFRLAVRLVCSSK